MLSPDSCTILIADDVAAVLRTTANMLQVLGYEHVLTASDGVEAMHALTSRDQVGLVICDMGLPRMNGVTLLKKMRKSAELRSLPFLMLASRLDPTEKAVLDDLDVSGLLLKPLAFEQLQTSMAALRSPQGPLPLHQAIDAIRSHAEGKDFETARELSRNAARELPHFRNRFQVELARIMIEQNQHHQARPLLQQVVEEEPQNSMAWHALAEAHAGHDEPEKALEAAERAVELSPFNADVQYLAGKTHLQLGQPTQSKKDFHRALNADPHCPELKERIWEAYLELGLVDRVEQDFGPYLFNHLGAETLNRQAMALRKQNRLEEAIALYQRALKLHPESQHLLYNLAVALVNQNRVAKAISMLERALKVDPDFAQAKNLMNKLAFLHEAGQ
jgi:predicted Zn-dependent protease